MYVVLLPEAVKAHLLHEQSVDFELVEFGGDVQETVAQLVPEPEQPRPADDQEKEVVDRARLYGQNDLLLP